MFSTDLISPAPQRGAAVCPALFWLRYLRRLWWRLWNESLNHSSLQYFTDTPLVYQKDLSRLLIIIYILNLGCVYWYERRLKEWKLLKVCIMHVYFSLSHTHVHTLSIGWFLLRWRPERRCHLNSFNRGWLTEDGWRSGDHFNCLRRARNPAVHSCILCLSPPLRCPSQSQHSL